jgi:hypothetical protein
MRNQQMDAWLAEALGVAKELLNAVGIGAEAPRHPSDGAPTKMPPSASASLPQPIAPDCEIVLGKVPGPANFVLCKTHGHVLDTTKTLIVAHDVDEFLKQHPEFLKKAAPTPASGTLPSTAPGRVDPDKPVPAGARTDSNEIVAQINDTLTKLDLESTRLKQDGIPSEPLDTQIANLRSRLASITKSGAATKQLTALQADAVRALERVTKDADRQADSLAGGSDKAIHELRDAAEKQINKLDAGNPKKAALVTKLKDLDAQIKDIDATTDASKKATGRQTVDKAAQDLIQAAVAAGGNSKDAQKEVQDAYKKALEEKYGITIGKNNTLVTEHTHLDKVYKMFEQVPIGHVVQDKLKDLSYNKRLMVGQGASRHGIGLFTAGSIQLGDYGEETWPYRDPNTGKVEKPNGFSISVLHELGHSVDTRWSIMDKYQSEPGCGGWKWHRASDLAQDVAKDFIRSVGSNAVLGGAVKEVTLAALTTGKVDTAPSGVDPGALKKLQDYLAPWIKARKAGAYTATHEFGGRNYFARGGESWLSYLSSARASLRVTDYQWSAPAEWFAELYAICWYKGEPAPAGVHQSVRAYMPQKNGGGGPGAPG